MAFMHLFFLKDYQLHNSIGSILPRQLLCRNALGLNKTTSVTLYSNAICFYKNRYFLNTHAFITLSDENRGIIQRYICRRRKIFV